MSVLPSALFAGLAAATVHGLFGLVHWQNGFAYAIIGLSMSLSGASGELIWRASLSQALKHAGTIFPIILRAGLWFLCGGIGYVVGMVLSKKAELLGFTDIPQRPLFLLGGEMWLVIRGVEVLVRNRRRQTHAGKRR